MKNSLFFTLFLLLFTQPLFSQTLLLLDESTLEPISSVAVFSVNSERHVLSDSLGRVFLDGFKKTDVLVFQHPSFVRAHALKSSFNEASFVFYLKKNTQVLEEVVLSFKDRINSINLPFRSVESSFSVQMSADVLSNSGVVFVQKSQFGGGSPILRGFESSRVLLLFDGVRLNNAIYRSGHSQYSLSVDPFFVKKTDIQTNSTSVFFGSDALGGSFNFLPISSKENEGFSVFFSSSFSSFNRGAHSGFGLSFSNDSFSYLSSFVVGKSSDMTMGKRRLHQDSLWGLVPLYFKDGVLKENKEENIQPNTSFSSFGFFQSGSVSLKKNRRLDFTHLSSSSSFFPRFDKLNDTLEGGVPKFSLWEYGPQKLSFLKLSYSSLLSSFWGEKQTTFFSFQKTQESRHTQKSNDPFSFHRKEGVDAFLFKSSFSKKTKHASFLYGIDFWHNNVSSNAYSENDSLSGLFFCPTRYPSGGSYMGDFSFFLFGEKKIKSWFLNAGGRASFSYLSLFFNDSSLFISDFKQRNLSFVGSFIALKNLSFGSFSFGVNNSYKNPNIDDTGKFFEKNGYVTVPNVLLKPEKTYSFFIDFSYKKGSFSFLNSVFFSYVNSAIVKRPFSFNGDSLFLYDGELLPVEANINTTGAFVSGFTSSFSYEKKKLFLFSVDLNYTYGKDLLTSEPMSHIPPFFGKTSFSFYKKNYTFSFYSLFNGAKPKSRYAPGSVDNIEEALPFGTPAWFTLNFLIKKTFKNNYSFALEATNLLDVHYKTFSSGVSAPGRGFSFSFKKNLN